MTLNKAIKLLLKDNSLYAGRRSCKDVKIALFRVGWACQYGDPLPVSKDIKDYYIQGITENRLVDVRLGLADIIAFDLEIVD